jgi:hypothetical protein
MKAEEIKMVIGVEKDKLHEAVLKALEEFTANTGLVVFGMAWHTYTAHNAAGTGMPEATTYVMAQSDIGVNA